MIEYFLIVLGIIFLMIGWNLYKKRHEIKENYEMYKSMMTRPPELKK